MKSWGVLNLRDCFSSVEEQFLLSDHHDPIVIFEYKKIFRKGRLIFLEVNKKIKKVGLGNTFDGFDYEDNDHER